MSNCIISGSENTYRKVLRDAYLRYVSNIFTIVTDSSDPDNPTHEKSFGHLSNHFSKRRLDRLTQRKPNS